MTEEADSLVELKPVGPDDAPIIFESWGRHPENFTHLTTRVFAELNDARAYIAGLFQTSESSAFHVLQPDGAVVGIVKAAVLGHRAQIGYVVSKPFWGRGFATSAVRQLVTSLEASPSISRGREAIGAISVIDQKLIELV